MQHFTEKKEWMRKKQRTERPTPILPNFCKLELIQAISYHHMQAEFPQEFRSSNSIRGAPPLSYCPQVRMWEMTIRPLLKSLDVLVRTVECALSSSQ